MFRENQFVRLDVGFGSLRFKVEKIDEDGEHTLVCEKTVLIDGVPTNVFYARIIPTLRITDNEARRSKNNSTW